MQFHAARIGAAVALAVVISLIVVLDVFVTDYEVAPLTLGILMAGLLTVLGLEFRDWRR